MTFLVILIIGAMFSVALAAYNLIIPLHDRFDDGRIRRGGSHVTRYFPWSAVPLPFCSAWMIISWEWVYAVILSQL